MKVIIAGEASVHVSNYCRAIRPYVDELVLLTETPLEVPEADKRYLVSFRKPNPLEWIGSLMKLKKIIRDESPDLIHVHQVNRLAYFASLAAGKLPVLATAWGSDVLLVPERSLLYRYFTREVIRRSLFVTADAQVMIDAMMTLDSSTTKYVLLQYGIDPVEPAEKEKIIFSNRLHRPLYNIDLILNDFADFVKSNPGWVLQIGGSGPETGKLKELANVLGIANQVNFLGWLGKEENDRSYARAEIYVSIPSSDGTSVSLLEAMSAGCIPVVSDLPVTKEWIEDGINGIVRKPSGNAFTEALGIDREHCVRINRAKINASVARNETTKVFFSLYQKALKQV